MATSVISLIVLGVLVACLCLKVPISLSLATSGTVGTVLLNGWGQAINLLGAETYSTIASGSLVVVPMFILLGMLALHSGIATHLYEYASRALAGVPGSLGVATVMASAGFAAVTGSSVATVATLGKLSISEMVKQGYDRYFAASIVGASGTLGVLIPPSIVLVLYGIISGESIGALLLAGIVPGIVSAVAYILFIGYKGRRLDAMSLLVQEEEVLDSVSGERLGRRKSATGWRLAVRSRVRIIPQSTREALALAQMLIIFGVIMGGIYTGYFTATESAAVGALVGLVALMVSCWGSFQKFAGGIRSAIRETVALSSMALMILVGASIFSLFLVLARIPQSITTWVSELPIPGQFAVAILLLCLIPLGMFLDGISILIITVPLIYPVAESLGFDGIVLGVLIVKTIEISLVTPPVGLNAYVVAGTYSGLKVEDVFRSLVPFICIDVLVTIAIFLVPSIVLWLPSSAG